MVQQVANHRVLLDDLVDALLRCVDDHGEAHRFVHPTLAVVQGLARQANAQIASIALKYTQVATHHVVQQLVAAAQAQRVTG